MGLARLGKLAYRNLVRQRDFNAIKEKLNYSLLDLPRNYHAGLLTTRANAQDITVAVGQARNTGDTGNILVTAAITKQIDADWAAGSAAGGFPDTALNIAADTWYHVFVIGKADGSAYDAGFDSSITAANLLDGDTAGAAGYTTYHRVASVKTDDAASPEEILDYTQRGNQFIPLVTENVFDDGSLTSGTAETATLLGCPIDHSVLVELNVHFEDAATTQAYFKLSSLDTTDTSASLNGNSLGQGTLDSSADTVHLLTQIIARTNTSAQVRYTSGAIAGDADEINIAVISWFDDFGKYD